MKIETDLTMLQGAQSKVPPGKQEAVACSVWFTSSGRPIPRMLKLQDASGQLHTLGPVQVIAAQKTRFSGIWAMEYVCRVPSEGIFRECRLLFFIEECTWKLIWKNDENFS